MNGISDNEEKHSKQVVWEKIKNDLIAAEKSIGEEVEVAGEFIILVENVVRLKFQRKNQIKK